MISEEYDSESGESDYNHENDSVDQSRDHTHIMGMGKTGLIESFETPEEGNGPTSVSKKEIRSSQIKYPGH